MDKVPCDTGDYCEDMVDGKVSCTDCITYDTPDVEVVLSCRNCDHIHNIQLMTFDCKGPPTPVRGLDIKKIDKHYDDSTCFTNKKLGYKGVE